ncbi:MAG: hypothetical protein QM784_11295 [Polyangiaceae bacterium]
MPSRSPPLGTDIDACNHNEPCRRTNLLVVVHTAREEEQRVTAQSMDARTAASCPYAYFAANVTRTTPMRRRLVA